MSELRSENNEINIFSSSKVTSLLSIVSQDIFSFIMDIVKHNE